MKKFSRFFCLLVMALLVFALSGCGGSSSHNDGGNSKTASKLMVVTSAALEKGESYRIYRGEDVKFGTVDGTTPKYYVANADADADKVTMNLEFSDNASDEVPFIITDSGGVNVLVGYNPDGTGTDSTAGAIRNGGARDLQKYTSLSLSTASVSTVAVKPRVSESDEVSVVLNEDGTATVNGSTISPYEYVWHIDPDYAGEYWTLGDSTTKLDEDKVSDAVEKVEGIYIARDVRYVPDTIEFSESQTLPKASGDEEPMYVAYYTTEADGVDEENKYVIAALPTSAGMGGGGEPPATRSSRVSASSNFETIVANMTHSADDAYDNPVFHITEAGTYRISGTWHGQIWIEAKKTAEVTLILDGVEVTCDVAPALVFVKGYSDDVYPTEDKAEKEWKTLGSELIDTAGARVSLAPGKTNTFTGANTPRINEAFLKEVDEGETQEYYDSDIGKYVKAQEKMYKIDGAFQSKRSLLIDDYDEYKSGTLTVTSTTYEGLNSELHMTIEGGVINVSAPDDGINVNEDNTSVFTMYNGTLTINSSGGDGIDSNGWVVINGGDLNITAGQSKFAKAGNGGIDYDKEYYIDEDKATYTWLQAQSGGGGESSGGDDESVTENITDSNGNVTTIVFQATSTVPLADGDTDNRDIPESSSTFELVNTVNNFGGITKAD